MVLDGSLPDGGPACPFFGDPDAGPGLVPMLWQFDGGYEAYGTPDPPAPLWRAFQGGEVLLVGAQIFNMYGCHASLTARLRDLDGGVLAEESRSVDFDRPTADGGATNDLQFWSVANVPACPNWHSGRNVNAVPWTLEVQVTDPTGRVATASGNVVPDCANPSEESRFLCNCECETGYTLGKCVYSPPDAGP